MANSSRSAIASRQRRHRLRGLTVLACWNCERAVDAPTALKRERPAEWTRGAEAGVRTKALLDGLDTSLSLWWQDFDSENLFEGDEGTTTFGRPSRRWGFEWTSVYAPTSWVRLDGQVGATHARFRGSDLVNQASYLAIITGGAESDPIFPLNVRGNSPGNYLTNAPTVVAAGGIEVGEKTGWFGALRYRYFGSRPLTEDGQIRSLSAGTLNARVGYRFDNGWKI